MLGPFSIAGLDEPLPRLVQGTLHLAGLSPEASDRLLDAAFELGINAFDTAPVYGDGLAEERLGAWVRSRGVRERVVLIEKGCHPRNGASRLTSQALSEDVGRSLRRLAVERIDLYLLHRDDPSQPVAPIVEALNQQREAGRIRAFGASNWSFERICEANDYARISGLVGFSLSSPGLSLAVAERTWPGCLALGLPADREVLAAYRRSRFPLLLWSPLAGGYLRAQGEPPFLDDPPSDEVERAVLRRTLDFYDSGANRARLSRARALAAELGTNLPALCLGYLFALGLESSCVLGCRDRGELSQCAAALELSLSAAQCRFLESGEPLTA